MKPTLSSVWLAIAAFGNLVQAGGGGDKTVYYTTTCWETKTPEQPPPKTYYSTVYVPTEVTKYSTVYVPTEVTKYSTTTVYQNVPTTVYENVPTTVYQNVPTTVYDNVPTTVYQSVPTTVYQNVPTTVYANVPTTIYVTQVATQVQATTVAQVVTVTDVMPTTVTQVQSGLVLCPTRTINPTYTPATPLPSNYIWGCKPGYICQPTKENCNFEQNPPADTYYCPPEQCQLAGPLPPLQSILDLVDGGSNCAWVTPDPGYFDLDPRKFGYSFAVFNIFGQAQCPAKCPPPSTVTVTETVPGQAPPPQTVTVPGQAPPPATVTVTITVTVSMAPPPPPPTSTWQTWSEPAKPSSSTWAQWSSSAPVAPSTWQSWEKESATQSHGAKVTPRAVLVERQLFYPMPCWTLANFANKLAQSIGFNAGELCPTASPFSVAYRTASECYSASSSIIPSALATRIDSAIAYCSSNGAAKRSAGVQFAPRRNRRMEEIAL